MVAVDFEMAKAVPRFEGDLATIRAMAPSGFVVGLQIKWAGPAYKHDEFNPEWSALYIAKNFFVSDPIFYWSLGNDGAKRWSEIALPDVFGVKKQARNFGLNFGAIVSRKHHKVRSFFTAAHDTREFTDPEIQIFKDLLDGWVDCLGPVDQLPDIQIDVLRMMKQGYQQKAISQELGISESTVKQRVNKAMKSLNAKTRTEVVAKAMSLGLLDTLDDKR